jgi:hypothetical protein
MKCRNSAFNAQGSKLIIVAAHVAVVKTCEAAVEGSGERRVRVKLSLSQKLMVFWGFSWMNGNVLFLFCRFFLNLTLFMTKLRVPMLCFRYIADNSIVSNYFWLFTNLVLGLELSISICKHWQKPRWIKTCLKHNSIRITFSKTWGV